MPRWFVWTKMPVNYQANISVREVEAETAEKAAEAIFEQNTLWWIENRTRATAMITPAPTVREFRFGTRAVPVDPLADAVQAEIDDDERRRGGGEGDEVHRVDNEPRHRVRRRP